MPLTPSGLVVAGISSSADPELIGDAHAVVQRAGNVGHAHRACPPTSPAPKAISAVGSYLLCSRDSLLTATYRKSHIRPPEMDVVHHPREPGTAPCHTIFWDRA